MNRIEEIMKRWFFLLVVFCLACGPDPNQPAKGFLAVTITLNKVEEIQPSYQTVIWLEDGQGAYLQTLYLSEYLSYGGFHDSTICTLWSKQSNWAATPSNVFDMVTQATPPMETKTFRFSCLDFQIKPGRYHVMIQTHLLEKYNITYDCPIKIGGNETEQQGTVTYYPLKHPTAKIDALSDVKANYKIK